MISIVGEYREERIAWPEGWPPPRVGDEVNVADGTVYVRHVVWDPQGDPEDDQPEPFVYIVLGPWRPE